MSEHANPWFTVERDGSHYVVHERHAGNGAVIVPRLAGGELVLIEQFRVPLQRWCLEFPRGYGEPGETAAAAAVRELREETGLIADPARLRHLGTVAPNSGLLATRIAVLLADDLAPATAPRLGTEGERIRRVLAVDEARLRALIRAGELTDGFTLAAFALLVAGAG